MDMKSIIITISSMVFAVASAWAADEGLLTQPDQALQAREHAQVTYQVPTDKDDMPSLVHAMQQYQFTNATMRQIQNTIREAGEKGLPTEPLMSKVYEGIAKKVDEDRIVQAVNRVQERNDYAYRHAERLTNDPGQVKALARVTTQARLAGLNREDCDKIMDQLQDRLRDQDQDRDRTRDRANDSRQGFALADETMTTARDMARRGVTSKVVAGVMVNGLQHGYNAQDMQAVRNAFARNAKHASPEDVAQAFTYGITRGANASSLGSAGGGFGMGGTGSGGFGGSGGSGGSGGGGGRGGGGGGGRH
jgi:hypothetical protein